MDSNRDFLKDFAGIAFTAGVALFTAGQSTAVLGLVNSVAGNLLSNFVQDAKYSRVKDLIEGGPDPRALNHDLRKLIIKSLKWTIRNINFLYRKKNELTKAQKKELQRFSEELMTNIENFEPHFLTKEDSIYDAIERPDNTIFKTFNLKVETFPVVNEQVPYNVFFEKHFKNNLQLCFGELLKDPDYEKAYKAYQREVYQKLNAGIEEVKRQNEETLRKIESPKAELKVSDKFWKDLAEKINSEWDSGKFSEEMEVKYLQNLEVLQSTTSLIMEELTQVNETVSEIKITTTQFDRKLSENWIAKNKVWFYTTITICIATVAGAIIYNLTRPFHLSIILKPDPGIRVQSEYPPLAENSKLKIYFPGETKERDISALKEAYFPNLPANLKGKKYAMELVDPYWKTTDSLTIEGSEQVVYIRPNDAFSRIHGRILSRDGEVLLSGAVVTAEGVSVNSDNLGRFEIILPVEDRKPQYLLRIEKQGYETIETEYLAGAAKEVRLERQN